MFLAEVYPIWLPFEPRPYEISRLDVAIPNLWRDETRAPVVVHLPIHHFLRAYATPEAVYMLDSTHHWARVVNGFSGASPHGFRQTMEALHALPESLGVAALAGLGVDLVAIHRSAPAASRRALAAFFEEAPWATVYHVGDEHLVRIDPASIPHGSSFLIYGKGWYEVEFRPNGQASGRWTPGHSVVSFQNPRGDARLMLEVAGRPDLFETPQQFSLWIGEQMLETLSLDTSGPVMIDRTLTAAELGSDDVVRLELRVDQTFIPSELGIGNDARELGARVLTVSVEPM